ncbi:MAG: response regulator transcription factor [Rhodocyclaceae bacterium]|nr:MAG: response regulator transcription factor [Rhodocyclaceae bacterium]
MASIVKPHIGLVEDNDDLREDLEFLLRSSGYTVWSAARGESFNRQLRVARTDVALIDLSLPDCDGLELIHRLRDDPARGVIVLTAHGDLETKLEIMRQGADHYLIKPVDLRELQVTIDATWRRVGGTGEPPARTSQHDAPPACWLFDPVAQTLAEPTHGTLELSSTESVLLSLLTSHAGELLSKERVLEAVYPGDPVRDFHRIEVVLNRLRQKARRQGIALPIRSVFGKGLVFTENCRRAEARRQFRPSLSFAQA